MCNMDEKLLKSLDKANERLRTARCGITLEIRGKGLWLYMRGTFPPKPGSSRLTPYQQRVALQAKLSPASLIQAEATAKLVGAELNLNQFDWYKWSDIEPEADEPKTLNNLWSGIEAIFWRDRVVTDSARNTWRAYKSSMHSIDPDLPLTPEILVNWVLTNTQPTQPNRELCLYSAKLIAKAAGFEINLDGIKRATKSKPINPRLLPTDEEICEVRDSIRNEEWRYIYGLMAAYGLRNHEVWMLSLAEFPIIHVEQGKTGSRRVIPLYPEWANEWNLGVWQGPEWDANKSVSLLGKKVNRGLSGQGIPFAPYNLRHSYARRCAAFGIQVYEASRLMGHSTKVHELIYRAWIGDEVVLNRVLKIVDHPNRPLPP